MINKKHMIARWIEIGRYITDGYVVTKYAVEDAKTEPKQNNDERTTCYACGAPVKQIASISSVMGVCTKCGK